MEISRKGDQSTFYVDVTGRCTLVCPSCHRKKLLDAQPYREATSPLRVNCPCGQTFYAGFDFRKNYIKMVNLEGECVDKKSGETVAVRLTRLSIEGVEFEPEDPERISHGQSMLMRFTLDNQLQTPVERTIKVTSVKNGIAGAMFVGGVRNKTVGFYLMP